MPRKVSPTAQRPEHQVILEAAGEGILSLDAEGVVTFANAAAARLLGYSVDELVGQPIGQPIDQPLHPRHDGRAHHGDRTLRRKDGQALWVELTHTPIVERGRVTGAVVVFRDVGDRRRAEAAVERERLRELFEQAPAAIAVLRGPDHVFELANPAYARLAGGHRQYVGRPAREVFPELAGQGFFDLLDRVYATGEPFVAAEAPVHLERAPGDVSEAFVNFVYQPIRTAAGPVDGIFVQAVDVTDLVRSRRRVEWLQEITVQLGRGTAPDAVGRQTVDAAAGLLGAEVAALFVLDDSGGDFVLAAARGLDEAGQRVPRRLGLASHAANGRQVGVVDDAAEQDGVVLPLLAEGGPTGAVAGAPLLVGDELLGRLEIYDQRPRRWRPDDAALLEALAAAAAVATANARLRVRLEEGIRARDDFLAAASHDLKNPLTSVRGSVQMLERSLTRTGAVPPERLAHALRTIDASVGRLAAQVDELLDVARLRLGEPLPLERDPTDLVALAGGMAAAHQAATDRHRITVEATLPALVGSWDRRRLTRVLDNLLSNAVKYSPHGGDVTISVAREGDWALLRVRDRGVGIPAADLPRVLERFERAGNVRGRIEGTGIGLAAAQQVIAAQGGTISLESEESAGTVVTVRLPLGLPE